MTTLKGLSENDFQHCFQAWQRICVCSQKASTYTTTELQEYQIHSAEYKNNIVSL